MRMKTSYSIGEFSKVTGLLVKKLRFYHENGILAPSARFAQRRQG